MNCPLCPCCGRWESWYEGVERYELQRTPVDGVLTSTKVTYATCPGCGLVGKFPLPPEKELRDYYENAWQYESQRPGYDKAAKAILRGIRSSDGRGIFPRVPSGTSDRFVGDATVLDVGSKGNKLAEALQAEGALLESAGGLDAQPKGSDVRHGWLGSGLVEPANHSIVSAAHVLEHVLRPDFFMADLASLTAEYGYIYIEVPSLRGGLGDVGLCDDLNRNHLWHYTLPALARLGSQVGAVTLLETDTSLEGWPVDRMVVERRHMKEANLAMVGNLASRIDSEYSKAADMLKKLSPANVGLYGASHSYAQLLEVCPALAQYRVFDQHKAGQTYRMPNHPHARKIEDPGAAAGLGSRKVYVTTRSYNSYVDIKRWLNLYRPELLVETPYASLAKAVGEGDFYRGEL